ncbi:MAG: hypothetical protein INR71_00830 [Terriglobus roseus]|nr:hypothetical protein [Terriglobus roseus]
MHFEQPVIQTAQMFIGEMGCWLVVGGAALLKRYGKKSNGGYEPVPSSAHGDGDDLVDEVDAQIRAEDEDAEDDGTSSPNPVAKTLSTRDEHGRLELSGWKVTLLALPACCDIAGTTLMNVGLLFVAASIYQMTRGALVLFVGLFSVVFLKRHLGLWKWVSLIIVVLGVAVVGLAGALEHKPRAIPGTGETPSSVDLSAHTEIKAFASALLRRDEDDSGDAARLALQTVVGVLLIALAQIFTASQFVLEESIMEKYSVEPLVAVGWEGVWGFVVTVLGMVILHFAYGRTDAGRYGYFDAGEGLRQITYYPAIAISSVLIMVSIG